MVVLAIALLPALALAAPLTLDQAIELAVRRSEATRAARAGVSSASESARAASQLPDPTLKVGIDNLPVTGGDRLSTTRDSMTMKRIGIGQEWLSAEKRAARQAAADAMVARESVAVRRAAADVRLQTALAYLDAFYVGETLKLTTLSEHRLHEELEAAKARLSSAAGSGQEVLAMTSARGVAEDESAEVRQTQAAAQVALARWTGQPANQLSMPPSPATPSEQAFVASSAAVLTAQRDVDVARGEASVFATNQNPNWTWEVSYGQRTGYSDMVSVGVSIPLPVARDQRQDRETAAKLAMVDKAEADLAEAIRAATADYRATSGDAQRLNERIERYRTAVILPTQQRTAAAMAGYRSNQVSLTTLFEARRMEVDVQRKLLALQRDLAKTQAQLAYRPLQEGGVQ
ncbi:MAG: TolC family protein [Burkholderiales bacterium]